MIAEHGDLAALASLTTSPDSGFPPPFSLSVDISYEEGRYTGAYLSPDGRYAVYAARKPTPELEGELVLVDLQTQRYTVIQEFWIVPYTFKIQWGVGSNAFVVSRQAGYGEPPFLSYVYDFETPGEQPKIISLNDKDEAAPEMLRLGIYRVYDFDSTGQYLLVGADYHPPAESGRDFSLILLNVRTMTYEIMAQDPYLVAARFEQPGNRRIFYMGLHSVVAVDRQTRIPEVITHDIQPFKLRTTMSCAAEISPDGRLIVFSDSETHDVLVVPLGRS